MRSPDVESCRQDFLPKALALALASLVFFFSSLSSSAATAEESSAEPRVTIPDQEWAEGEAIAVTVEGFPAGVVALAVCGQNAERGSADCNLASSTTMNVGPESRGTGELTSVLPASGCPCVVRATTLDNSVQATTPVRLAGVTDNPRVEEPEPEPEPEPEIADLWYSVTSTMPTDATSVLLRSVAGPATVNLTVTITNPGPTAHPATWVAILVGRNTMSGEFAAEIQIDELEPGGQIVEQVTIEIGAPTWGVYTLHGAGEETAIGTEPKFDTTVTTWPLITSALGLTILAALILQSWGRRKAFWAVGIGVIATALIAVAQVLTA